MTASDSPLTDALEIPLRAQSESTRFMAQSESTRFTAQPYRQVFISVIFVLCYLEGL